MDATTEAVNRPASILTLRGRRFRSVAQRRPQPLVGLAERDIVSVWPKMSVLLVIDDERSLWRTAMTLSGRGYSVATLSRAEDAPVRMRLDWEPDVIVLDLDQSAIELTSVGRALHSTYAVPIVYVTECRAERPIESPLGRYRLTRPYAIDDLIEMLVHATGQAMDSTSQLVAGGLIMSGSNRQVTLDGQTLQLSDDEFVVLWRLASAAGGPISRRELRDALMGFSPDLDERIVDWYAVRLMVKLASSQSLSLTRTDRYDGYVMNVGTPPPTPAPLLI